MIFISQPFRYIPASLIAQIDRIAKLQKKIKNVQSNKVLIVSILRLNTYKQTSTKSTQHWLQLKCTRKVTICWSTLRASKSGSLIDAKIGFHEHRANVALIMGPW